MSTANQSELLPAPILPVPPPDKWRSEQAAFRRLLPELLKTYEGQYVAIHEGKVVEHGGDILDVADRAYSRWGYVPIYVDLVSSVPPPVWRIPSVRNLRPE
jgi:hypothetical protein